MSEADVESIDVADPRIQNRLEEVKEEIRREIRREFRVKEGIENLLKVGKRNFFLKMYRLYFSDYMVHLNY